MSHSLFHGSLKASVVDVVDAGVDLLPHFELACIPLMDAIEQPAEWPQIRRRLRAEGVRYKTNRGAILLAAGELDHVSSVGMFQGNDEIYLCSEWNDEFEPFPGRIGSEYDFAITTPLGLEEWMVDVGCLLALGDGAALNYATLDAELERRLRERFATVKA